ncbi:alpha-1,6-mannosyltransferase [Basidiobolus ranarum]|uniref:Alpha-1,6-mannosyltransferase n=1 Tax=Basidiobolus ranarum TaxID=34480 RepID=A0ABR2WVA2_9FUNG
MKAIDYSLWLWIALIPILLFNAEKQLASPHENLRSEDIAIVMAWDERVQDSWLPKSLDNKRIYANRHGYEFLVMNMTSHHGRAPSWYKIEALYKAFKEHPEKQWFWWLDVDTLIMELDMRIEDLLDEEMKLSQVRQKDIVISWDCFGLTMGSFMLRNTDWNRRLLFKMMESVPSGSEKIMFGEQRYLQSIFNLGEEMAEKFHFIPPRKISAALQQPCEQFDKHSQELYDFQHGDFLIHFSGCGAEGCKNALDFHWNGISYNVNTNSAINNLF